MRKVRRILGVVLSMLLCSMPINQVHASTTEGYVVYFARDFNGTYFSDYNLAHGFCKSSGIATVLYDLSASKVVMMVGDVNLDSAVNLLDIPLLKQYLVKDVELTKLQLDCADVNNDGRVTVMDLVRIQQYYLNNPLPPNTDFDVIN